VVKPQFAFKVEYSFIFCNHAQSCKSASSLELLFCLKKLQLLLCHMIWICDRDVYECVFAQFADVLA